MPLSRLGISQLSSLTVLTVLTVLTEVIRTANVNRAMPPSILSFVASVFISVSLHGVALVMAITFATIIAGRVCTIALMRLNGSSTAM